jgi:hypothetical protein
MKKIYIEVHAVPDRALPVAEVYSGSIMIAEISREDRDRPVIQVCNIPMIPLDFGLDEYIEALREADKQLVEAIEQGNYTQ